MTAQDPARHPLAQPATGRDAADAAGWPSLPLAQWQPTTTSDEDLQSLALEPQTVADFYHRVLGHLDDLGRGTRIWPMPVEIEDAIPMDEDNVHAS
jgi:hypothetical protein